MSTTNPLVFDYTVQNNLKFSSEKKSIFTFEGVNKSDKSLFFVKSIPSCGCTTSAQPTIINPNERFTIALQVDKVGQSGYTSQSVRFFYRNEEYPNAEFVLQVSGTIN